MALHKDELIETLHRSNICALPQSAAKMIELSRDPQNGPKEFAVPISADLGLASQVLRFVNSSFFGFRHRITSIPIALSLASVRTIKNFVLWNGLFAVLPDPHCGPFSLKKLFQDALRRAIFSRKLAENFTKIDGDEAFTCGLMQDMAIPVLAKCWEKEYAKMIAKADAGNVRLSTLEQEYMGWTHSEAGEILAKQWGFDTQICEAVSQHVSHDFKIIPNNTESLSIISITALSGLLPKSTDRSWLEINEFLNAYTALFGEQYELLREILSQTDRESEELGKMIHLGPPPKQLSMIWQETLAKDSKNIILFENLLSNSTNHTVIS